MGLSDGILQRAEEAAHAAEAEAEVRSKDLEYHIAKGLNLEGRACYATLAIAAEMRALRLRQRFEREYAKARA